MKKRKVYGKFVRTPETQLPGNLKTRIIVPTDDDWPGDAPVDQDAVTPFKRPTSVFQPEIDPLGVEEVE